MTINHDVRGRRMNLTELVDVLCELALALRDTPDADPFAAQTGQVFVHAGGLEDVVSACEEHLAKGPEGWRAYAQPHFWEQRRWRYPLVEALPLRSGRAAAGLVDALKCGDIYVECAANYGASTNDIFPIRAQPAARARRRPPINYGVGVAGAAAGAVFIDFGAGPNCLRQALRRAS